MTMEKQERMFDENSFTTEITSKEEAEQAFEYYSKNIQNFLEELTSEGLTFEDAQKEVRQCWENLLKSSQRVGYANARMVRIAKHYRQGNK